MQLYLFSEMQLIHPAQMELIHVLSSYTPTTVHAESPVIENET